VQTVVETPIRGLLRSAREMTEIYEKVTEKTFRNLNPQASNTVGINAWETAEPFPTYTNVPYEDRLTGKKNPHHRTQIIWGRNATTAMNATETTFDHVEHGRFTVKGYSTAAMLPTQRAKTIIVGSSSIPSTQITDHVSFYTGNAANMAAGTWYKKVRNAMSGFKGSVFTAESRQAKRMMCDRANRMLSMIPPFQRRLRKSWVKSRTKRGKLKTLSNSWLELQFGWLPLASDIEDLYKVLQNPRGEFKFIKAYGVDGDVTPITYGTNGTGYARCELRTWYSYWAQTMYHGKVRTRDTPAGSRLLDFGLGVREFLPTLWEVIPWSFAIDYFTNISEIVDAISYRTVEVHWVNRTDTLTRTWKRHGTYSVQSNLYSPTILENVPMKLEVTRKSVGRIVQVDVPVPTLTFQIPNLKQFVNLAALAVSRRLRLAY